MEKASDILKSREMKKDKDTVNWKTGSVNTGNSMGDVNGVCQEQVSGKGNSFKEEFSKLLRDRNAKAEHVAELLANGLGDIESLPYYELLIKEHGPEVLLEALSYTKDAQQRGVIERKPVHYFLGILRRKGLQTKFKEEGSNRF